MLNRRKLANAVTQIEHLRTVFKCIKDCTNALRQHRATRFDQQRIEIALHRHSIRQFRVNPSGIKRFVHSDRINARFSCICGEF